MLDQAISSATNFGLTIAVAHFVPPKDFGAFSLGFALFVLCLGITRAICTGPLTVRHSASPNDIWKEETKRASGAALSIGLGTSTLIAVSAAFVRSPLQETFLALAVAMPALMLQDAWRFAFFAEGQPQKAAVNDLVWAGFIVLSYAFILAVARHTPWLFITGWGLSGLLASVFGIWQAKIVPQLRATKGWLRDHSDLWPSFLGEFLVTGGSGQIVMFGLGGVSGLRQVAAFRGAQLAFGPIQVTTLALSAVAVPEGTRMLTRSRKHLVLAMGLVSVVSAFVALAWGLFLRFLLPRRFGIQLIGGTWSLAEPLLFPTMLMFMALAITQGAASGLRVLELAKTSLVLRVATSTPVILGGIAGAALAGAKGAAWGVSVPLAISSIIWWRSFQTQAMKNRPK